MKKQSIRRLKKAFPNLVPVVGLFLVIFGVFGLVFVQDPLQRSQDIRQQASTGAFQTCNQTCTQNADCDINYRCFKTADAGSRCRLATNPTSSSCSPVGVGETQTQPTTTTTPTPTPTVSAPGPEKGNPGNNMGETITPPVIEPSSPFVDEIPEPTPTPDLTAEEDLSQRIASEQTALDTLKNLLRDGQFSLPIIVLAIGLIILILSLVVHLLKKIFGKKSKSNDAPPSSKSSSGSSTPKTPEPSTPKPKPVPPPKTMPQAGLSHPLGLNQHNRSSTMVNRAKDKGIL